MPSTLLVTFSGIDGAGKSTLLGHVRRCLEHAGLPVLVLTFWQDVAVLRRLREFISCNVFGGDRGVGSADKPVHRRDKNVQSPPVTVFRLVLYLLDAARLRWVVARAKATPAKVVLFDRYLYDEVANLPLKGPFGRAYARLLLSIAPKPYLACLVDGDPDLARQRKPEYPIEFLRRNRQAYLTLSELLGGMLVVPSFSSGSEVRVLQELLSRLKCSVVGELSHQS